MEEIKLKMRIHELEQKMETSALSILTKKNELGTIIREKGKDNIQAKVINEEIEESNSQIRDLKNQLEQVNGRMLNYLKRRENFQGEWRSAGHREFPNELLNNILR